MLSSSPFHPGPDGHGPVTLAWSVPPGTPVEIHLGSPYGDLVSAGESSGSFDTGAWVTGGTRFFLQQPVNGGFGVTLASLTIHAGPTPPLQHYIAVLAGAGTNPSYPVSPAILIFDRDTLDQLTRVALPAVPFFTGVADGGTLYLPVGGSNPGVVMFDLAALATRGFVPLPVTGGRPVFATGANGATRVLFPITDGIAAVDPASGSPAGSAACPFSPSLIYNPANQTTYGWNPDSEELCVIAPQFQVAPPIPLGFSPDQAVLLPGGRSGFLLLTTLDNPVGNLATTVALDAGTLTQARLAALNATRPALAASRASTVLYAAVAGNSPQPPVQRFDVSFSAGWPVLTPGFPYPPPSVSAPFLYDGRYLYSNIPGYCSTLEGGVFGCSGGFTLLDPATLATAASVVLGSASPYAPDAISSVQNYVVVAAGSLPVPAPRPPLH
jgi:hypothetical protein